MEQVRVAAEVLLIVVGAVGFYEARSFSAVHNVLSRLGFLKRFIVRSRTVTVVENAVTGHRDTLSATATGLIAITPSPRPPGTIVGHDAQGSEILIVQEYNEDLPSVFYFTTAALIIAVWIGVGRSILFWLGLPFTVGARSVTVWTDLSWSWSVISVPLISLGYLLLGVVSLFLIYTYGVGSTLKSAGLISEASAKHLSPSGFKFMLFVLFVGASLLVLLTG